MDLGFITWVRVGDWTVFWFLVFDFWFLVFWFLVFLFIFVCFCFYVELIFGASCLVLFNVIFFGMECMQLYAVSGKTRSQTTLVFYFDGKPFHLLAKKHKDKKSKHITQNKTLMASKQSD